MEWIKDNWFDIIKLLVTIFGIGGICGKIIFKKYEKFEAEKEKRKEADKSNIEGLIEGMQCLLRSNILNIYYKAMDKDFLYQWERENLDKSYKAYYKIHGNTFVEDIMEQLKTVEVRPNK